MHLVLFSSGLILQSNRMTTVSVSAVSVHAFNSLIHSFSRLSLKCFCRKLCGKSGQEADGSSSGVCGRDQLPERRGRRGPVRDQRPSGVLRDNKEAKLE